MACNGICFWTRVSETPEKGRKKDRQESEGKEGWVMDETYHPICFFFLKDSFFLPFPPFSCLWSNYLLQWYSRLVAQEKDSPVHLSQPLQISGPLWEGERKKGSKKEGCTLKSGAVVTQEREGGVILLWHFSSLFILLSLSDEDHRLYLCFSRELHVCFCVCMCTVVMSWVSDLLEERAATVALCVP